MSHVIINPVSRYNQIGINIIVPLVEEGLDRRLISFKKPWFRNSDDMPIRYTTEVEGLPAVVELGISEHGKQLLSWALMPGNDPLFKVDAVPKNWPGEVWGMAIIDRRLSFYVDPLFYRCRNSARRLIANLPARNIDDVTLSIGWAA